MNTIRIIVVSVLLIGGAVLAFIHYRDQENIRREYLAKGIYEIRGTFTYRIVGNSLFAYYMICEPPSQREELIRLVLRYIHENAIVQELQKREPDRDVDSIDLVFIEPSQAFPIGWNGKEPEGFSSRGDSMVNHILISVVIPKGAQSQNEYLILPRE